MHITLPATTATDYYEQTSGKEIDWLEEHEGEEGYVSLAEGQLVEHIVLMELAVYTLRRSTGSDQSMSDRAVSERRELIDEYESKYGKFEEINYDEMW